MAIANTVAIAKQVTDWDFTPGESEAGPTALGGPRGSGKPLSGPEQISHQRIRSSVRGLLFFQDALLLDACTF